MKISRIATMIVGLLFGAVGLAFWITPEETAAIFGLEAIGISGLISLRADLGGLFLALGALCVAGGILQRRSFLVAAALLVSAIAIGRVVGLLLSGPASNQPGMLAIEIAAIAVLILCSRTLTAPEISSATTLRPGNVS